MGRNAILTQTQNAHSHEWAREFIVVICTNCMGPWMVWPREHLLTARASLCVSTGTVKSLPALAVVVSYHWYYQVSQRT